MSKEKKSHRMFLGDTQRQLVFFIGPGKSGTKTAAAFCNQQHRMVGIHEGRFGLLNFDHGFFPDIVAYTGDYKGVQRHIEKLHRLARIKELVSCRKVTHITESAMYFLQYAEQIIDDYPDVKFVCLERDHEKTIASWLGITGDHIRHWSTGGTVGYVPFFTKVIGRHWDQCFPKYDLPHESACRSYVKNYYHQVETLQRLYPNNIRKVSLESFVKNRDTRTIIFEFIGYHGNRVYDVPHEHKNRDWLKFFSGRA